MWRSVDLVLRFVYLIAAPLLLTFLAATFPLTGTLVGAAIATIVALIGGDRWHAAVDRIPVLGRALGGMAKLGEFYREHPPKPLVYYIAYPVLLPVILFMKVPRREFTLYRKVNGVALVVIVVAGAVDYVRHWQPELGFGLFVTSMIAGFVIQLLVMFALVMPIVTTLIMLRLRGHTKALYGVLVLVLGFGGLGIALSHHQKHAVPYSTWTRLEYRSRVGLREYVQCTQLTHDERGCIRKSRALQALLGGLDAARASLVANATDVDGATAAARAKIGAYYKADEARAFQLYAKGDLVVEYVRNHNKPPVVIGFNYSTHRLVIPSELPADAKQLIGVR